MSMNITTAQLARLFTQAMQGAQDTGFGELKVGSVVQATLLEVMKNGAEALIQVGANRLMAKLDADLQAGDQVALLVTGGQKNGALELKVVGQQGKTDPAQTLEIGNLLKAVGLPEQAGGKALVNEWLARQLPLQSDVLQAAYEALRQAKPGSLSTAVTTLGKMAELGIPIHSGTFAAMSAWENGPPMHELFGRVLTQLQALLPESATGAGFMQSGSQAGVQQTQAAQEGPTGAFHLTAPLAMTENAVLDSQPQSAAGSASGAGLQTAASGSNGGAAWTPGPFSDATATNSLQQPLSSLANQANAKPQDAASTQLFPGIKISRQVSSASAQSALEEAGGTAAPTAQDPSQTNPADANNALSPSTRQTLADLSQAIRHLLAGTDLNAQELAAKANQLGLSFEEKLAQALRRLPADSTPAHVKDALSQALQSIGDKGQALKQLLLSAHMAGPELEAAGLHALHQDLGTLLQQVTGQQLMHAPSQRSDLFYQFAAVPLQLNGQQQTLELHVMSRKSPGQKKIDPANCYILFRLNMPHLGELDIHLHIVDKVVGLRFLTEATENVAMQAEDQKELRGALQAVGFHLGTVKVEEPKQAAATSREPLLPPLLTQGALDVKA